MCARTILPVLGVLLSVVLVSVNYSGGDSGRVLSESELVSLIGDAPTAYCLSTGKFKCMDPFIVTKSGTDYCSYCDSAGARNACCPADKGDCNVDTFTVQCSGVDKYYYPDGYTNATCSCVPVNQNNTKQDGSCNLSNVQGAVKCPNPG
jgi:hypothetical protein